MRSSFNYIFWGLLLVFLNVSINGFDLLPNGLGYLLIAVGASQLVPQSPKFGAASALSAVLILAWLCGFVNSGELSQLVALSTMVLSIAMNWFLLGGIMDVSSARNRTDFAERASQLRICYAVVMLVNAVLLRAIPLAQLGIVLAIAGLVVGILTIYLVYRVRNELDGAPPQAVAEWA